MNKVLLIGINARYSHPAAALYYLKEYIKDLNWESEIKEFTIRSDINEIINYLNSENPRCVAFSVYIWNNLIIRKILRKLDEQDNRPVIILGGPEAGYNPDFWISNYGSVDFITGGFGEESFRLLLKSDFKHKSKYIYTKNPPFSEIPFPYNDNDLRNFRNRIIYYESGRGCPFKCAYCVSSREDQNTEYRDISTIKNELNQIMRYKPKTIKFVDRTFNADTTHAHAVWKHIIETYSGSDTRFHFELHPVLLTEDDLTLLAGCPPGLFQFEIGIQSINKETLRAINRKGSWEKIKPAIKRIVDLGTIPVHVDLIAGLPFEDCNTFAASFNEAWYLGANHFQVGYLKLLPGTMIKEKASGWEMKSDPDPPYELLENKWIDAGEMKKLKIISKLVDSIYNSHRFQRALENILASYNSPFNFFENIADEYCNLNGTRWEDIAVLLKKIIKLKNINSGYMQDCLRWDWHSSFGNMKYPEILRSEYITQKRKELFSSLMRSGQSLMDSPINKKLINRSGIFIPETGEFRKKYMDNKNFALFPHGSKHAILFN